MSIRLEEGGFQPCGVGLVFEDHPIGGRDDRVLAARTATASRKAIAIPTLPCGAGAAASTASTRSERSSTVKASGSPAAQSPLHARSGAPV